MLVVLGLVVVLVLGRDLRTVEQALDRADTALTDARASLASGDVDASGQALQDARRHLAVANGRVNRVVWRAAEKVPLAGRSLETISGVVDVADQTARLGRGVVDGAEGLLGPDGSVAVRTRDGRIPLAPLRDAAQRLDGLDSDALRTALDRLRATPTALTPSIVADARGRALERGTEVADTFDAVQDLMTAVPSLLGDGGPRRYFLAMQNPAELRGTGGLMGFFATVDARDGNLELSRPASYEAIDDNDFGASDRSAASASEAFVDRYGYTDATSAFSTVNVDPDLPTTGPVMADLYRTRTGQQVDGVIAVDPIGLAILLQATGPVDVPDDVAALAPALPDPTPVQRVPTVTMFEIYEQFEGRNDERRDYLREFASTAFDTIFDARWDGVEMTRQVAAAITSGHLAVYVDDEDVQSALVDLDAAGTLAPPEPDHDHVAVIANNAAGNKLDFHVGHRISGTVTLSGDRGLRALSRTVDLQVEVLNEFDPTGRSDYVVGSFPPGAFLTPEGRSTRGPRGLSRTWFSTWVPGAADMAINGDGVDGTRFNGHTVADVTVEATTGQTASFRVSATGPAPVRTVGRHHRYTLELRRQPKAIPDRVDLTIVPPSGWQVVGATLQGGGNGGGSGPHGDPGPALELRTDDEGNVQVTGDVSANVEVALDLVPQGDGVLADVVGR